MKITRRQLRKLISEAVIPFPTGERLKELLTALKQEFVSNYDQDDPSMVGAGFESWVEQVNNAIEYVDMEVGDDLSKFEATSSKAYDMLMMAEFSDANQHSVTSAMTRASDVKDDDKEFEHYLNNLELDNVEELPGDDDNY